MQKIFASTLAVMLCLLAAAQFEKAPTYKPFKVDVSTGFALPMSTVDGGKGGILLAVEPKYAIIPQLSLGLRFELAMMAKSVQGNSDNYVGEAQVNASYLATADYYFSQKKFRPFVGAGVGMYSVAGARISSDDDTDIDDATTANNVGGMIRAGFEASHFRLGVEYNIAGKTDFSAQNDYFGFKIGVCIGGGPKK